MSERLWKVVGNSRSTVSSEPYLSPGDLLKLGRIYLRVRALSLTGEDSLSLSYLKSPVDVLIYSKTEEEPFATCRICLCEGQTQGNPLISVCECAGTMRYIHLECLQEWLRTRLDVAHNSAVMSYHWKSMDCELCKTTFPMVIALNGCARPLVDVNKSNTPYILLEETGRRERGDIHVVSLPVNSGVSIGRSPQCDIVLADVSVSREHCVLRLTPEGFSIEDRKSKFGTLRKVSTQRLSLTLSKEVLLQVNRTLVSLRLHRPSKFLYFCCYCCFPPRTASVLPESSLLKHTISSVMVTTYNPHTDVVADTTEQPAIAENYSNVLYENTAAAVQISEDEERSRLIAS